MSQSGGLETISRPHSPGSLKRKREHALSRHSPATSSSSTKLASGSATTTDGHSHTMASSNGVRSSQYTSPDSDGTQTDQGEMLHGVGSASSRGSVASSKLTSNSHAFAQNRNSATANGLTPLTNLTESSPPKGNSPRHSKSAADMASIDGTVASQIPASDSVPAPPSEHKPRAQMLPPPGKVKGYRAVWDPELDGKLSKEERKRAQFRKREFGTEVRYIFHILLSLRNIIHIT